MTEALRITLIGMGLVFAAMALVLAAMLLLVRLRDAEPEVETADSERVLPAASDDASSKLCVAMIAAAMARARSQAAPPPTPLREAGAPSLWWAHHQTRQLYSLLRKRA
jgi:Na+-transporting methylmalonyl-CoA/oxaloacetate decarboxylase gamma subunit